MIRSTASLGRRLGNGLAVQIFAALAAVCLAVYGWAYLSCRTQRTAAYEDGG